MLVTWDFLKTYSPEIPLPTDVRTPEVIELYTHEFKLKSNFEKKSIIYDNYLENNLNLHKNKYPYNSEEGVYHYVLWVHPDFEKECNSKIIEKLLDKFLKESEYNDYIYFENHKDCRSILNEKHYQIFFK